MFVRDATPADAAAIARVRVETWRATYRGAVPDAYLDALSVEEDAARWARGLADPEHGRRRFAVVAEEAGAVIGFACGGPERGEGPFGGGRGTAAAAPAGGGERGEAYAVYVLDRSQRRGAGRRLMGALAERLAAAGFASAIVWVLASNERARRFYESLGGAPAGATTVEIGGAALDDVAYAWADVRALLHRSGMGRG